MNEHLACLHEQDWGALWEILKSHTAHVLEGDKSGGYRDRLVKVELEISQLKKAKWFTAITGGVIGALIGSGSNEVIVVLVKWMMGK